MKTQHSNVQTKKVANVAVYLTSTTRIDDALRKFRKKLEKYGTLDLYKEKQVYIKPSDLKHQQRKNKKK